MLDPELPPTLVRRRKGKAVGGQRMGKKCGVEIEPQLAIASPIDPTCEVFRRQGIAIHLPATSFGVKSVQVHSMPPGDQRQGLFQISPQLGGRPSPARIRPCGLDPGPLQARLGFKPSYIVPLPTVERNWRLRQTLQCGRNIDPQLSILLGGQLERLLDPTFTMHDNSSLSPAARESASILFPGLGVKYHRDARSDPIR